MRKANSFITMLSNRAVRMFSVHPLAATQRVAGRLASHVQTASDVATSRLLQGRYFALSLLLLFVSTLIAQAQDASRIDAHVEAFSKSPHRLAGTDDGRAAGDYIIAQLKDAGVEQVLVQPIPVMQLHMNAGDCYIEIAGKRTLLDPIRPNGIALPVTPSGGVTGQTVYLSDGRWSRFEGVDLKGKIAVFDYTSGGRWKRAIAHGAKAIIFVGPAENLDPSLGQQWVQASAEIPRFFIGKSKAQSLGLLTGVEAKLFCRMQWKMMQGRNIFALIPGTEEQTGEPALISLACEYDTFGTLPFRVEATRNAANVAGAIEAARDLANKPHKLPTLVAFFDNNAQSNFGQWWFYFARGMYGGNDPSKTQTLAWIIDQRTRELASIEKRRRALEKPIELIKGNLTGEAAEIEARSLQNDLEQRYNTYKDQSYELKVNMQRLTKDLLQIDSDLETAKEAKQPDAERIALLEANRKRIQRLIDERTGPVEIETEALDEKKRQAAILKKQIEERQIKPEQQVLFDDIVNERLARLDQRKAEAEAEIETYKASQEVAAALDTYRLVMAGFLDLAPVEDKWTLAIPSRAPAISYGYDEKRGTWGQSINGISYLTNPQLSNYLFSLFSAESESELSLPNSFGIPEDAVDDSAQMSVTTGQATYLLKFGHIGILDESRGQPTAPKPNINAYAAHLAEAMKVFRLAGDHEAIGRARVLKKNDRFHYLLPEWVDSQYRYRGSTVNRYGGSSVEADIPVANAVIKHGQNFRMHHDEVPDRVWGRMRQSTVDGLFSLFAPYSTNSNIVSATFNDAGQIQQINQLRAGGYQGEGSAWNSPSKFWTRKDMYLSLFEAKGAVLFNTWAPFPRIRSSVGEPKLLDGISNVALKRMNLTIDGDLVAFWAERPQTFKFIATRLLLLGNDKSNPVGRGVAFDDSPVDVYGYAAGDLWTLNEDRLDKLRRHGVMQNSLEALHAKAESYLDEASQSKAAKPGNAEAQQAASLAYSGVAYEPIRSVTNDLIKAVVILLLLAIPFAFAVERLIVGTPNVYKQLGGFILIFLTVFGILYSVHPAFQFATFPIVVLLAFVIIIMSSMVIYIMWSKFEYEIRSFQGIATASHQSSRSGQGTVSAAIGLGISTMRRRPLRTFLTALTIVLLTFTILFFGAFSSEMGIRKILVGPGSGPRRIEMTPAGAGQFSPSAIATIKTLYSNDAEIYTRRYRLSPGSSAFMGRTDSGAAISITGYTLFDARDLDIYPTLRQALTGDIEGFQESGGIFLAPDAFEKANAKAGQTRIVMDGREWVVRGRFDPQKLMPVQTVEGAPVVPPDVDQMRRLLELQNPQDEAARKQKENELEISAYPEMNVAEIALAAVVADRQESPATTVVLLPKSDDAATRIAGEIATMTQMAVTVQTAGEVNRVLYAQQLAAGGKGGFAKLFVPLLLGGLIVFSTMLSSVSDREREIFTFSALGLAPVHVAVLFFAEAAVYSVIGGLGGYLFSQVFGKVVEQMAIWGWVTAPAMNYSSMNAMAAILVVMLTVLISTIYPAFKASRSANPGIQRKWRMPKPENGKFDLLFPFTVSEYDLVGMISFLEEYFLSHQERSVGSFAADQVKIEHVGETFVLSAVVWLQPFDQGVSQRFEMRTEPSDIEGVDQVRIRMERQTGSPAIWERSSKVFVNDIRQQFIFWRTIDESMMDHYREMTARRFGLELDDGA